MATVVDKAGSTSKKDATIDSKRKILEDIRDNTAP